MIHIIDYLPHNDKEYSKEYHLENKAVRNARSMAYYRKQIERYGQAYRDKVNNTAKLARREMSETKREKRKERANILRRKRRRIKKLKNRWELIKKGGASGKFDQA